MKKNEIHRQIFDNTVKRVLAKVKRTGTIQSIRWIFLLSSPIWQREVILAALDELGNAPQRQILLAALELVETAVTKLERLSQLEDAVYRVYDNFDAKTKASIAAMLELSFVVELSTDADHIGYGLDWDKDALYKTIHDKKHILNAQKELPNDPDISVMTEVFHLSDFIRTNI